MKVYKLTNQDHQTHGNCQWGVNVTHETNGIGALCGSGWLHFYTHPLLAVLFNPIHGNIKDPVLWEAEAEGQFKDDHGLKGGCTKLTTLKAVPLPELTTAQKVRFAILCSMALKPDVPDWNEWAGGWLNGENRAAGWAAGWAAWAAGLDLIALAEQAVREEQA